MYRIIMVAPAILLLAAIPIYAMAQLDPANGYNDGVAQARADANSGNPMDASCTAHAINNVGNEQYCINYKAGYLVEQGMLGISH